MDYEGQIYELWETQTGFAIGFLKNETSHKSGSLQRLLITDITREAVYSGEYSRKLHVQASYCEVIFLQENHFVTMPLAKATQKQMFTTFDLVPARLIAFTGWLFVANMLVITGTALVYDVLGKPEKLSAVLSKPWAIFLLSQLNLSQENTLATWYSSMLLFVTGILALFVFMVGRNRSETKTAYSWGWLLISGFFVLLSLDELGSLHENAGRFSVLDLLKDKSWESVLFLPLVLIMVYMVVFLFLHVKWKTPAFWTMVLGALFFISIPIQEHVESGMWRDNGELWTRPVAFVLLEEGAELFGTLLFFAGMVLHFIPSGVRSRRSLSFSFQTDFIRNLWSVTVIMASVFFVLMYLLQPYMRTDDGIAINWFPAALTLLVLVVTLFFETPRKNFLIIYSFALSGYFGCDFYAVLYWDDIEVLSGIVRILMAIGLVTYIYFLSESVRDPVSITGFLAGGMLISVAFLSDTPLTAGIVLAGLLILLSAIVRSGIQKRSFHSLVYDSPAET